MPPEEALQILKEGNRRFVTGKMTAQNFLEQVKASSQRSNPYAVILNCFDSRVPPEIIFDQGIGNFFTIRIGGNIVDEDILGSMEFACGILGLRLILVMGHTKCQAVKGAIDGVEMGNLSALLAKIRTAADQTSCDGERTSANNIFVEAVAKKNVFNSIQFICEKSSVLKNLIDNGELTIAGAMYDIETGKVEFY